MKTSKDNNLLTTYFKFELHSDLLQFREFFRSHRNHASHGFASICSLTTHRYRRVGSSAALFSAWSCRRKNTTLFLLVRYPCRLAGLRSTDVTATVLKPRQFRGPSNSKYRQLTARFIQKRLKSGNQSPEPIHLTKKATCMPSPLKYTEFWAFSVWNNAPEWTPVPGMVPRPEPHPNFKN